MLSDYVPEEYKGNGDARLCRIVEQIIEVKNPLKVPPGLSQTNKKFITPMDGTITDWIRSGLNCVK